MLYKHIYYVERLAWFFFFSFVLLSYAITTYAILHMDIQAIKPETNEPLDYIYFSIVTFTTLGYGDFSPLQEYRLLAASQALLGYVYLGSIVSLLVALIGHEETT